MNLHIDSQASIMFDDLRMEIAFVIQTKILQKNFVFLHIPIMVIFFVITAKRALPIENINEIQSQTNKLKKTVASVYI